MNFWETVLGNELARTLIRELPRITEHKDRKEEHIFALMDEIRSLRKEVQDLKLIVDEKLK